MAKEVVEIIAETSKQKQLRWARILVSVLTFGMVFPNAMTERMAPTELPPYVAEDKKGS